MKHISHPNCIYANRLNESNTNCSLNHAFLHACSDEIEHIAASARRCVLGHVIVVRVHCHPCSSVHTYFSFRHIDDQLSDSTYIPANLTPHTLKLRKQHPNIAHGRYWPHTATQHKCRHTLNRFGLRNFAL